MKIIRWLYNRIFKIILLACMSLLCFSVLIGFSLISKNKDTIIYNNNLCLAIKQQNEELEELINHNNDALSARIDNLDNIISYEDKRRVLVERIRKAIIENTNTRLSIRELNSISNAVIDYSYEWKLTIPQVLAQIKAESNFNIKALSPAGAQGLMQIMPRTLRYIKYEMPQAPHNLSAWNIHHNVRSGCFYMSQLKDDFGSYKDALIAYNWGPDNLEKFKAGIINEDKIPRETLEYVPKIMGYIQDFKKYGLDSL